MSDDVFTDEGDSASALEELVGEGKKFVDYEALAKGKLEADNFIETLKREKQLVEEELARFKGTDSAKATVADLLKELQKANQTPTEEGGDHPMSDEDFQEKVKAILRGEKESDNRKSNRELAHQLVLDKVGGDREVADAYVAERARQLGITKKQLGELSEESPQAFAKLMELDSTKTSKPTTSLPGVRTGTLENKSQRVLEIDGHKTKAHYDKLRKDMGVREWVNDSNLQTQMAKDMRALGERFNQ